SNRLCHLFSDCMFVVISIYLSHYIVFFFFFQAEDGIRDDLVTGVQTCALPISSASPSWLSPAAPRRRTTTTCSLRGRRGSSRPRSEERRVGKECRSRWAACT